MAKVKQLSSDVIAKIAAGEVVDRPSCVVKELVENALDAGATSVEVHLKEAGKSLIHIKDNGSGIDKDDLEIIFERHATSKISSIDDLESLRSLGFRGEALYSVAAIADVQLKSLARDESEGWEVHMRGGAQVTLQPAAIATHGTDIKVSEIFYNVPARKKFLKSNVSEMNAILSVFLPYTMLYPHVRFLLINEGKTHIDVRPTDSATQRFAEVLNLQAQHLIEDEFKYESDGTNIRCILGNINIQRKRRDLQYLFVNGRPVANKNLEFQVNDMYRLIFPPQTYSAFAVFIDVLPENVDANIHPTKREVKIRDEYKLSSKLRRMVENALMTKGSARVLEADKDDDLWDEERDVKTQGIPTERMVFGPKSYGNLKMSNDGLRESSSVYSERPSSVLGSANLQDPDPHSVASESDLFRAQTESLHERFARSRYIGQFINKFLLFEVDQSLFYVDQHAAQERIMFERFRNQINDGDVEIQNLLTPVLVSLSPQEQVAWEETSEDLQKAGFETTQFDDQTIAVQTHPVLIKKVEPAVRAILAQLKHERCDYNIIARRACKASIVTGDKLSIEQALHQRVELLACEDPFTCPHGRPTMIEIKESFLDKQFLRT